MVDLTRELYLDDRGLFLMDRSNDSSCTAAEATLATLRQAGIDIVFGNPGTTELPVMGVFAEQPEPRYSLALHEGCAVSAAAGYALTTGRPGVAFVHAMPGVGNAMSMFAGAARCGVPLVLIAGTQDRRHQFRNPIVQADLTGVVRPVSKSAWEARTSEEVPLVIQGALEEAARHPTGGVFVSVPMDLWNGPAQVPEPRERLGPASLAAAPQADIELLCDMLLSATAPVLVTGDCAGARGVGTQVEALAELLGAPVHWAPVATLASFPSGSDFFGGPLVSSTESFQRAFAAADLVLGVGAELVPPVLYAPPDELLPPRTRRACIAESPADPVGLLAPELSLYGDLAATLEQVVTTVHKRLDADADHSASVTARRPAVAAKGRARRDKVRRRAGADQEHTGGLAPATAISAILSATPKDAIVVDEAVSNSGWIPLLGDFADAPSYLSFARGGALGYGVGTAFGASLGSGRPVLAVVGDGALMYAPQGLWSIATENRPVVVCVLNNGGYQILRHFIGSAHFDVDPARPGGEQRERATTPYFAVTDPPVDLTAVSQGCGVRAVRVDTAAGCAEAVDAAFRSGHPWLIDITLGPTRR